MGTGLEALVDPELRVRGIEELRVVDASIMPVIPRMNTNAPTMAVAEQVSDLIRESSSSGRFSLTRRSDPARSAPYGIAPAGESSPVVELLEGLGLGTLSVL